MPQHILWICCSNSWSLTMIFCNASTSFSMQFAEPKIQRQITLQSTLPNCSFVTAPIWNHYLFPQAISRNDCFRNVHLIIPTTYAFKRFIIFHCQNYIEKSGIYKSPVFQTWFNFTPMLFIWKDVLVKATFSTCEKSPYFIYTLTCFELMWCFRTHVTFQRQ